MNTTLEKPSTVSANIVLPLMSGVLLLPNASVAEIVLAGQLSSAVSSPFLLGYMAWREQEIPIISFEGLLNGRLPEGLVLRQMAVFNGLSDRQKMPYFGVALSGVPRLVRLRESDITPLDTDPHPLLHSQVRAVELKLMIPNWDALEQEVLAVL